MATAGKKGAAKVVIGILAAALLIPVLAGLAIFGFMTLGRDSGAGDGENAAPPAAATASSSAPAPSSASDGGGTSSDPSKEAKAQQTSAAPSSSVAQTSSAAGPAVPESNGGMSPAEGEASQTAAGAPAGALSNDEASLAALHEGAERGEQLAPPNGQFVAQLSSKYPGVTDKNQVSADGDHVFTATEIVNEYQQLHERFGGKVVLVRAPHFGKQVDYPGLDDPKNMFVTLYTGNFATCEEAKQWCQQQFPDKTGDALNGSCYPRQLVPPHAP